MRVRLYPTKEQKKIIIEWTGLSRFYYNRALDFTREHKEFNFRRVRDRLRVDSKYEIPEWMKIPVSPRIISGAIQDCCKAYKTGFTQVKRKLIPLFDMGYRTKKDKSQCLHLEKSCFTNKGILPSFNLGKIKGVYKRKKIYLKDIKIEHDCRLSFSNDEYYLYVPIAIKPKSESQVLGGVIALDSGVRTFQTGYSLSDHTVEIGVDITKRLTPILNKIDQSSSFISKCKIKRKRQRVWSKIKRLYKKIRNKVDDLHWKTIKFLTSNYQEILVSDFKTRELLKGKLDSKSKRILAILSHYEFRKRLEYKGKMSKSEVLFVDESFTTKTCCQCGELNHLLGGSKKFKCSHCGLKIDRDINASRNILNKNYDLISTELHVG